MIAPLQKKAVTGLVCEQSRRFTEDISQVSEADGQFSMGDKKMSKINIYILNFFCDVSTAQLNGELSSKNKTEKKIGFSGKNTDFCN